jgi:hypothetical protein
MPFLWPHWHQFSPHQDWYNYYCTIFSSLGADSNILGMACSSSPSTCHVDSSYTPHTYSPLHKDPASSRDHSCCLDILMRLGHWRKKRQKSHPVDSSRLLKAYPFAPLDKGIQYCAVGSSSAPRMQYIHTAHACMHAYFSTSSCRQYIELPSKVFVS